jgi:hypothetical protein
MQARATWQAGAFAQYLRTGRIVIRPPVEVKFNPYHDPRDGRFTFAPGGGTLPPPRNAASSFRPRDAVVQSGDATPRLRQANFRPNPRARPGGNSRAFNDPLTLDRVFPGLQAMPGGSIIALADNLLDLTGPGQRLTADLSLAYTQRLIRQIQTIDPGYRFESLGFPDTLAGQVRQINGWKMDRATAFYKTRNELKPLQIETLRFLQARTDAAYAEGVARFEAGRLRTRLSREEAIGNFVDKRVRDQLRDMFANQGVSTLPGNPVRVNNRAANTNDGTFRVPDSRVGDIAFDVTLTRKTRGTGQILGFFRADFQPSAVVIVRPSVLGTGATYVIKRP